MLQDGSWRGYLRTNAAGNNLNRCWAQPTLAESPEVYFTQKKMRETGVDMCIDVHGDEAIPANFIAFSDGIPGWTDKMKTCKQQFSQFLEVANPDFQTVLGYPVTPPGESNLLKATDAIAQEFDCFAFTLEMPFKDCAAFPDPEYGWNPDRAKRFGASFVTAIRQIVPAL
jgi:murein tripeptide amidase MpaA